MEGDLNKNNIPDYQEDVNKNNIPDYLEDRNQNQIPDYQEDENNNDVPDYLETPPQGNEEGSRGASEAGPEPQAAGPASG